MAAAMVLSLTGGHWAALQSVAWARMIVSYSRAAPLPTALAQTFDGKHPCGMCRVIRKARDAARQHELKQNTTREETALSDTAATPLPALFPTGWPPLVSGIPYASRTDPPPVPPPRPVPVPRTERVDFTTTMEERMSSHETRV